MSPAERLAEAADRWMRAVDHDGVPRNVSIEELDRLWREFRQAMEEWRNSK